MSEHLIIGEYRIIGEPGAYRVMENFGSFRMLKKVFKTLESAQARAERMSLTR